MKKIYIFVLIIIASLVLNNFLYSKNLIELTQNIQISGFYLKWPIERLFIEPFYAFAYYIMTMERTGYVFALASWIFWITVFALVMSKYKKNALKQTVLNVIFAVFFFVSAAVCVIILPVPGPKLANTHSYKVFDIHSHTISSKDATGTVKSNINLHSKHGFTNFFITEHDNTKGFKTIPHNIKNEDYILPGIQIRTTDGISILLLSKKQFKYEDFQEKSIEELINLAHLKGMLVVVPHWWKWNNPPLQKLVDAGVDGFEIYNCGYRYLGDEKRKEIIDICKNNNLMMFGSTDWHGYGYMSNIWTIAEKNGETSLFDILSSKPQLKVIVHNNKGSQSAVRYAFEPFFAFYYYIKNTQMKYILSFYMIFGFFAVIFFYYNIKILIRIFSLIFAVFFMGATFYYVNLFLHMAPNNVVIPGTILPIAGPLSLIWLIIWIINGKNIQS